MFNPPIAFVLFSGAITVLGPNTAASSTVSTYSSVPADAIQTVPAP